MADDDIRAAVRYTKNYTCALWYWRHHNIDYELCETEEEAARAAVYMLDYDGGAPAGVQFADGWAVELEEWAAYRAAYDEIREEERRRGEAAATKPKPPTRKAGYPFDRSLVIEIEASEPAWLGVPISDA